MSTILGIGGVASVTSLKNRAEAAQIWKNPQALTAKRWAMVVDMTKFQSKEDYQKCIDACNIAHNVPQIPITQNMRSSGYGETRTSTPSRGMKTNTAGKNLKKCHSLCSATTVKILPA